MYSYKKLKYILECFTKKRNQLEKYKQSKDVLRIYRYYGLYWQNYTFSKVQEK